MESMNTTINFKVKDLGFFVSLAVSSLRIKSKLLHINKKYDKSFLSKKHITIKNPSINNINCLEHFLRDFTYILEGRHHSDSLGLG